MNVHCARCHDLLFIHFSIFVPRDYSSPHKYSFICQDCNHWNIGRDPHKGCGICSSSNISIQPFPKKPICPSCIHLLSEWKKEVESGGVWWTCSKCKSEGVVKAGTPLAQRMRKMHGVDAPSPLGIEIHECPSCSTVDATKDQDVPSS